MNGGGFFCTSVRILILRVCSYMSRTRFKVNPHFKMIPKSSLPTTLEVLPIEITLCRFKFLLIGLLKSSSVCEKEFLLKRNKAHNFFSTKYKHITLTGDFYMQPEYKNRKDICDLNQLEYLILKPTCYKGKNNFNN